MVKRKATGGTCILPGLSPGWQWGDRHCSVVVGALSVATKTDIILKGSSFHW